MSFFLADARAGSVPLLLRCVWMTLPVVVIYGRWRRIQAHRSRGGVAWRAAERRQTAQVAARRLPCLQRSAS